MFNILLLTGEQIRAARALARIEQTELARLSTLSLETIKRLERIRGSVDANARTLRAIQNAFHSLGISFHGDGSDRVGVSYQPAPATLPLTIAPLSDTPRLRRLVAYSQLRLNGNNNLRPTLAAIHRTANSLYTDHGLTGLKLILDGYILLAIEGTNDSVQRAYQYLQSSPSHNDLRILDDRPTVQAIFTDFGFCCGLFPSDLLPVENQPLIQSPFDPAALSASEAIGLLMAARKRQDQKPRNGCQMPANCALTALCLDPTCGDLHQNTSAIFTPQG